MEENQNGTVSPVKKLDQRLRAAHGSLKLARSIADSYRSVAANTPARMRNPKCRIVFLVEKPEVFPSVQTIAEAAFSRDDCEVFLLPLPRCYFGAYDLDTIEKNAEFCRSFGTFPVLDTYDSETGRFFDLESLKPDYIFLSVPYTEEYPEQYQIQNLCRIARVCFVVYGYLLANGKRYNVTSTVMNTTMLRYTSYVFADGPETYHFCKKRLWLSQLRNGKRLYPLGFPRFDRTDGNTESADRNRILWIPRWTTEAQEGNTSSSFFRYKDRILDYAARCPETQIVIRPHPSAFKNYIRSGKMTEEEVRNYQETSERLPNVLLDSRSSYLPAINETDIVIADFSSIIMESFIRNKPIVYTGPQSEMTDYLRYVTDTFYYVQSWEDAEAVITGLQRGNDPKQAQREAALKRFMKDHGQAGERIAQQLADDCRR